MPRLKLNLPPLVLPQNSVQQVPKQPKEVKKEDVPQLIQETKNQPKSHFQLADVREGYQDFSKDSYKNHISGYRLSNIPFGDVFIHANRENDSREFLGDKIHISLAQSELAEGVDKILPLLLSEDSPIDKWKVTDLSRCPSDSRVAVGAQMTLYVKADKEAGYEPTLLKKVKDFLEEIEMVLNQNGISPGEKPESDVSAANWHFISYRNEHRSDRDGTSSHLLYEEPFYQIMSS
ncbi:type III secretion system effector phosphothreonine lyase [Algicola sagamiensis]|uniref:VirA protein n=1 Tax=Algicola sagamiensis TaxID=163869 RepID=UPI000476EB07|nr:VirA protein [Algicola sagamiensis]